MQIRLSAFSHMQHPPENSQLDKSTMPVEIIDVHSRSNDGIAITDIPQQVVDGLFRPCGQKQIPTMLLYDEEGLRLYDNITTQAPEYYLFAAEEEILMHHADEIVETMHHGADVSQYESIVELGAGTLRKTSHILLGLSRFVEKKKPSITYYALDLEQNELRRVLDEIRGSDIGQKLLGKVETKGIWGTYQDGLNFIRHAGLHAHKVEDTLLLSKLSGLGESGDKSPVSSASSASDASLTPDSVSSIPTTLASDNATPPLHIMFLGSSLGNFSRSDAAAFLGSLPLRPGSGDTLLIGLDHDNEKDLIEQAYNDPKGIMKRFMFNGLKSAGRVLGNENMFDESKWEYGNSYNPEERRHDAFFRSKCAQNILEPTSQQIVCFAEEELLKIAHSLKFSETDTYSLFINSNLRPVQRWMDKNMRYSLWLLERPSLSFPLPKPPSSVASQSSIYAYYSPFSTPTRDDWRRLWACWDLITRQMIPPSMLFQKPIELRRICLFYLGHIPTFLDIHLSRLLQELHTEPEEFKYIFERGIDPSVDDPTECHPHSEVPVNDEDWPALGTILKFQSEVRARLMRLYDDIESGKVPLTRKIGRVLFMALEHEGLYVETLLYILTQSAGSGTIPPPGFIAPSWRSLAVAWNEAPKPASKTVTLGPTTVTLGHEDREADDDITDDAATHEYGWDNEHSKREVHVDQFRIEWRPVTNGEFINSMWEKGKAKLPCLPVGSKMVRTLYGPIPMEIAQEWPVITSYNDLSTYATLKGGRLPTEPELALFYAKFEVGYEGGANIGFRNWHPIPATTGGERNGGKGTNGGVWEWTSTVFDEVEGFIPSKLYPGYSMDFFDKMRQVVIGGSYATIPMIAERKTFRTWYQRNYAYPWVGGRVVYDN